MATQTKIVRFAENFYDDRKGRGFGLFLKGGVYRVPADLNVPSCTQVLRGPDDLDDGEGVKVAREKVLPEG